MFFYYYIFYATFLVGSDHNSLRNIFQKDLDQVFKKAGLEEFNKVTRISKKIVNKSRDNNQLEALIFLSSKSYEFYLENQAAEICQQNSLDYKEKCDLTRQALAEFRDKKNPTFIEELRIANRIRDLFMQHGDEPIDKSEYSRNKDINELKRLLPAGLLDDSDEE